MGFSFILLSFISSFTLYTIAMIFFDATLGMKDRHSKLKLSNLINLSNLNPYFVKVIDFLPFTFSISAFFLLIHYLNYTSIMPYFFKSISYIIVDISLLLFFKGTFKQKLFVYFVNQITILSSELFYSAIISIMTNMNTHNSLSLNVLILTFAYPTYGFFLHYFLQDNLIPQDELNKKHNSLFTILVFLIFPQIHLIWHVSVLYRTKTVYFLSIIFLTTTFLAFCIFLKIIKKTIISTNLINNMKIIQNKIDDYEQYNETTETYINEIRKINHDIENNVQLVHSLIGIGELEAAKEILNSISEKSKEITKPINSGNAVIDIVLGQKIVHAYTMSKNLKIHYNITLLEKVNISQNELSSILFNLLDNAIESAIPCKNPRINFNLLCNKEVLSINLTNSCQNPEVALKNIKNYTTTKENKETHGIGLKIIDYIVEKYSGTYKFEVKNNELSIKLFLKNNIL
ncbi:MAG: sensor histidine kinase [Lachnospirales bacterium]